MELIETIPLQNGLRLTIHDLTRRIAADTVKVEVSFRMKVKVEESFFTSSDDCRQLTGLFGDELTYEHKLERTFVSETEKEATRAELLIRSRKIPFTICRRPTSREKWSCRCCGTSKATPTSTGGRSRPKSRLNNRDGKNNQRKTHHDQRFFRGAPGRL